MGVVIMKMDEALLVKLRIRSVLHMQSEMLLRRGLDSSINCAWTGQPAAVQDYARLLCLRFQLVQFNRARQRFGRRKKKKVGGS